MKKNKKVYNYISSLFLILIFIYIFYALFKWFFVDLILENHSSKKNAVVINEKNIYPNQNISPRDFSYSYSFFVNNIEYKGDSQSSKFSPGDTIEVLYLESFPSVNRPAYYLRDDKESLKLRN